MSRNLPKTPGEAAIRILLKGVRAESIERRLRKAAPKLELIGAEEGEPPDLVAIGIEDYRRLVDHAEDHEAAAAYARTRDEESVPSAVADRILDGENPIKVWREHRGLTLAQLGDRIGKSKSFLSEIEGGIKHGTVETLKAIAATLDVDIDDIA